MSTRGLRMKFQIQNVTLANLERELNSNQSRNLTRMKGERKSNSKKRLKLKRQVEKRA